MHTYDYTKLIVREYGIILANELYEHTKSDSFERDQSLMNTMREQAVSIPSSIASAYSRIHNQSLVNTLTETIVTISSLLTLIRIAYMQAHFSEAQFDSLYEGYNNYKKEIHHLIGSCDIDR